MPVTSLSFSHTISHHLNERDTDQAYDWCCCSRGTMATTSYMPHAVVHVLYPFRFAACGTESPSMHLYMLTTCARHWNWFQRGQSKLL